MPHPQLVSFYVALIVPLISLVRKQHGETRGSTTSPLSVLFFRRSWPPLMAGAHGGAQPARPVEAKGLTSHGEEHRCEKDHSFKPGDCRDDCRRQRSATRRRRTARGLK